MIKLLTKIFVKEKNEGEELRQIYGMICSGAGIGLNVLLFLIKEHIEFNRYTHCKNNENNGAGFRHLGMSDFINRACEKLKAHKNNQY